MGREAITDRQTEGQSNYRIDAHWLEESLPKV